MQSPSCRRRIDRYRRKSGNQTTATIGTFAGLESFGIDRMWRVYWPLAISAIVAFRESRACV
jgi:hypothetical protein